jgi:HD-like signal output (HDOD) protein
MAIRVVGHRRLRTLLCHLIAGKLLEILRLDAPEVDRVRRKALAAAVVCARAAEAAGDADEIRVAGLLHNIGELALASEFPRELRPGLDPLDTFGVSFEAAGAMLLRSWRLPGVIADAAFHWRAPQPDGVLGASQRTIDFVHVGATLAEAWMESATPVSAAARVHDEVLHRLELSESRLAAIFDKIPSGIEKIETIL